MLLMTILQNNNSYLHNENDLEFSLALNLQKKVYSFTEMGPNE